mgnify:CR=1 FL=1
MSCIFLLLFGYVDWKRSVYHIYLMRSQLQLVLDTLAPKLVSALKCHHLIWLGLRQPATLPYLWSSFCAPKIMCLKFCFFHSQHVHDY